MNRELIINLIKAYTMGDDKLFRETVCTFVGMLSKQGERELAYYVLELMNGGDIYGKSESGEYGESKGK